MANRTLKVVAASLMALSMVGALTGCASDDSTAEDSETTSQASERNAELDALIEQAKEEGALTITWAVYPDAVNTELIEAFKDEYDLDIPVQIAFESNIDTLAAKLTEESEAGVEASSDLFLTTAATAASVGSSGSDLIEPQDWASFSPWNADFSEADGEFLVVGHQFPGFIYNTNTVDENDLPTTASDVLKMTDYAIASTPYGASFNTLAIGMGGPEAVEAYLAEFEPAGLINCGEVSRVASGEFDAMWVGCGKSYVDEGVKDGAPLGYVSVSDGAVANSVYVAVPKNSEHPAAAALFAAWLNTSTAQQITWDGTAIDNAQLEGSHSADYIAELKAEGTDVQVVDVAFVLENPQYFDSEFKSAIVALLSK
ncbi:MAG: extracellular solute-binding protein [Microbacterium sp.]